MNAISLAEILPNDEFVAQRERFQREVIGAKELRRLPLGPNMTLLFENRLTCWWQVQEMCRVEGIRNPEAVQHELDTYNALLPTAHALSATLLIGYADAAERDRQLRALVGLHRHLFLEIAGIPPILARFDADQFNTERVSAVQFLRIPLDPTQRAAFLDFARPARFVVDHPAESAQAALTASVRGALVEDLTAA